MARIACCRLSSLIASRFVFYHISILVDLDTLGLHRLGYHSHQADCQQAVGQIRVDNFNVIIQVELALKGAIGNALVQILAILVRYVRLRLWISIVWETTHGLLRVGLVAPPDVVT